MPGPPIPDSLEPIEFNEGAMDAHLTTLQRAVREIEAGARQRARDFSAASLDWRGNRREACSVLEAELEREAAIVVRELRDQMRVANETAEDVRDRNALRARERQKLQHEWELVNTRELQAARTGRPT